MYDALCPSAETSPPSPEKSVIVFSGCSGSVESTGILIPDLTMLINFSKFSIALTVFASFNLVSDTTRFTVASTCCILSVDNALYLNCSEMSRVSSIKSSFTSTLKLS